MLRASAINVRLYDVWDGDEMTIKETARQAASALYGRDYYPDPNEVADAVVMAVLREAERRLKSTGGFNGITAHVNHWLAEFSAHEGRPEPPLTCVHGHTKRTVGCVSHG